MFFTEDHTYNELRKKSLMQWLDEMEQHEDIAVHSGVKLAREYILWLEQEKEKEKQASALKEHYLRQMREKYKK